MPKRAVFERSRRELSLDVSVGVHILLVVEQSSLECQSRGVPRLLMPILTVNAHRLTRVRRKANCVHGGTWTNFVVSLFCADVQWEILRVLDWTFSGDRTLVDSCIQASVHTTRERWEDS